MKKDIESMAGDERKGALDNETGINCRDCIFWYRCKLGGIDCEMKER